MVETSNPIAYRTSCVTVEVIAFTIFALVLSGILGVRFGSLPAAMVIGLSATGYVLSRSYCIAFNAKGVSIRNALRYQLGEFPFSSIEAVIFRHTGYGAFNGPYLIVRMNSGKEYPFRSNYGREVAKLLAKLMDQGVGVKVVVDTSANLEMIRSSIERFRAPN